MNPQIIFGKTKEKRSPRRFTLAADMDNQGHIYMAMSICSPRDNFSRKLGREIASKRLREGRPLVFATPHNEEEFFKFVHGIKNKLEESPNHLRSIVHKAREYNKLDREIRALRDELIT